MNARCWVSEDERVHQRLEALKDDHDELVEKIRVEVCDKVSRGLRGEAVTVPDVGYRQKTLQVFERCEDAMGLCIDNLDDKKLQALLTALLKTNTTEAREFIERVGYLHAEKVAEELAEVRA